MKKRLLWVMLCISMSVPSVEASAAAPQVLVSLLPLHSLVASVMQGVGEPELLVPGGASPHNFSLRPSQARAIQQADLLVWVGPELEMFLARSLSSGGLSGRVLTLADRPELNWLTVRSAGVLEQDTKHQGEDDHHHAHDTSRDYHFWLSPTRAIRMAEMVSKELGQIDPAHAYRYQVNLQKLKQQLEGLKKKIRQQVLPVIDRPYVVFHDAYRYFEEEFQVSPRGAVSVNPERPPGARRIREIRDEVVKSQVRCVFSEPQFEPKLVQVLIEGTGVRSGTLDPLGAGFKPGPATYQALLGSLGKNLVECLGPD